MGRRDGGGCRAIPARELNDAGALGEGDVGDAEDGEDAAHGGGLLRLGLSPSVVACCCLLAPPPAPSPVSLPTPKAPRRLGMRRGLSRHGRRNGRFRQERGESN
jgi:hypothetical protein